MLLNKDYFINSLNLEPHVEGGYYRQVYKDSRGLKTEDGKQRALYTSIYFLLEKDNPSHFHRLTADEIWYYHDGDTLTIHQIFPNGEYQKVNLGPNLEQGDCLQYCVPKGTIFGSTVDNDGDFSVVSCMVSPGFEYDDFELFQVQTLLDKYPEHEEIIRRLTKD